MVRGSLTQIFEFLGCFRFFLIFDCLCSAPVLLVCFMFELHSLRFMVFIPGASQLYYPFTCCVYSMLSESSFALPLVSLCPPSFPSEFPRFSSSKFRVSSFSEYLYFVFLSFSLYCF